ncbi:hypothetical protein [Streptomyces atratus]|uniref:hypothetical protein n=1 Tax=Streptomyces atratus TaxID=1893 RepID=UPI0036577ACD
MNASYALAVRPAVARQITAVAAHFTTHRPTDRMTEAARMTVALNTVGNNAAAVRPILRALPFPAGGITRGEYALRVRKTAWANGGAYEWTDADHEPVIPRRPVPRPRTASGVAA